MPNCGSMTSSCRTWSTTRCSIFGLVSGSLIAGGCTGWLADLAAAKPVAPSIRTAARHILRDLSKATIRDRLFLPYIAACVKTPHALEFNMTAGARHITGADPLSASDYFGAAESGFCGFFEVTFTSAVGELERSFKKYIEALNAPSRCKSSNGSTCTT